MPNAACVGHSFGPSLAPFAAATSVYSGLQNTVPARPALPKKHGPPLLASPPKPKAQVVRAPGTGRRAQVRRKRLEKEFGVRPWPPRWAPARGAEEFCPGRGEVTQVALSDPKTPLPLSPARLRFSASPDQARKHPEVFLLLLSPDFLPSLDTGDRSVQTFAPHPATCGLPVRVKP